MQHDEFYGKRYSVGKAIKSDLLFVELGQMLKQIRPIMQNEHKTLSMNIKRIEIFAA